MTVLFQRSEEIRSVVFALPPASPFQMISFRRGDKTLSLLIAQQTIQSRSAGLADLTLHVARQVGHQGRPAYLTASPMNVRCTIMGWSVQRSCRIAPSG